MPQTPEERRAKNRAYRELHREEIRIRTRAYRKQNREKLLAQDRAWREKNHEKVKARSHAYWEKNKEMLKVKKLAYIRRYPEKDRAWGKKWRDSNRDQRNERSREYRLAHRDEINKRRVERYNDEAYRERQHAIARRYRAAVRKRLKENRYTRPQQDEIYAAAQRAVPRSLPDFIRDDAITDILIAVLEGKLALADIQKEARRFTGNYVNRAYKELSLDAPVTGTDLRWIDTIEADNTGDLPSEEEH